MHLDPFALHHPATVDEALATVARLGPAACDYLAGGTDLLPNYKMHLNARPNLVALGRIPELCARTPDRLGAMVRLGELDADPAVGRRRPALAEAVGEVATPLVRASGTGGGNLLLETRCFFFNQSLPWRESLGYCLKAAGDRCHVVPQTERCYATHSGDLAPALLALDASVEIAGPAGRRTVPVGALYDAAGDGIRRLTLAPGEILIAVDLPPPDPLDRSGYRKLRVRPSFDFPELGVAARLRADGGRVAALRLAVGGVETYPRAFDDLTAGVVGGPLSDDRLRALADSVQKAVRPVHNTFLPPDYRKRMVGVYVRRLLEHLRAGAAG